MENWGNNMKTKVDTWLQSMTLEEKASLCSGIDYWHLASIDRLGIPSILVCDGPHGLRKQEAVADHIGINKSNPATCYPTASLIASSWDVDLIYKMGEYLGVECQGEDVAVLLGPGVNIKRSPLCGRNFEYFSEDPYLTGQLAASFIQGVQSRGVGTSLKHYAVNNQEKNRLTIDAIVDERTMREIYLSGFEIAIKASNPWTVMSAYNQVNGHFASEHNYLLRDILRSEWGYQGVVMTDWGACNDRVVGLRAGNDLEMPSSGGINNKKIIEAIQRGELEEEVLNQSVKRLLHLIQQAQDNKSYEEVDYRKHHEFARQLAGESMVLLKNEEQVLPLSKEQQIAVVGKMAKQPRYQGAGSSHINPTQVDDAYSVLCNEMGNEDILYADGYTIDQESDNPHRLMMEAIEIASQSDYTIIFAGLPTSYESEGFDREHMGLPEEQNQLIHAISRVSKHVIVVMLNGAPVEMPWINEVSAVLEAYLSGQAGSSAIVDLLYGHVNPSGKLAETFPIALEDNPSYNYFPGDKKKVEYREGIYVGYRYYNSAKKEVLFPFGHGLSYTDYSYTNLQLSTKSMKDTETLQLEFGVKNIGKRYGKEVIQVYVRDLESTLFRPDIELKAFQKIALEPNEEKKVSMQLDKRAFAYYNVDLKDWCVESGEFQILVGASSKDIHLQDIVYVESTSSYDEDRNDKRHVLPSYYQLDQLPHLSKNEFHQLYGKKVPEYREKTYHLNSTLQDIENHWLGKHIAHQILNMYRRQLAGEEMDAPTKRMMETMLLEYPLRSLIYTSDGQFTQEMADCIIDLCNGQKRIEAMWKLIRSLIWKK